MKEAYERENGMIGHWVNEKWKLMKVMTSQWLNEEGSSLQGI